MFNENRVTQMILVPMKKLAAKRKVIAALKMMCDVVVIMTTIDEAVEVRQVMIIVA